MSTCLTSSALKNFLLLYHELRKREKKTKKQNPMRVFSLFVRVKCFSDLLHLLYTRRFLCPLHNGVNSSDSYSISKELLKFPLPFMFYLKDSQQLCSSSTFFGYFTGNSYVSLHLQYSKYSIKCKRLQLVELTKFGSPLKHQRIPKVVFTAINMTRNCLARKGFDG